MMKAMVLGLMAAASVGAATAEETITLNQGEWATSMSIFTAVTSDGELAIDAPEVELYTECWDSDEETELNLDWVDEDACTVSNLDTTLHSISVNLTCSYDGIAMTGSVDMSAAADRNSVTGFFKLSDDMAMDALAVDVVGSFTAQRVGACKS